MSTLKLNLKQEFSSLQSHVRQRIKDYSVYVNCGPGRDQDAISLITLGYSFDESRSWYALVFDTRPNAVPDGEWQSHIDENWITQFQWDMENVDEIDIKHYDPNWKEPSSMTESRFAKLLGELNKDVLIAARTKGLFAKLPLSEDCVLSVEEAEGRYGWPRFRELRNVGRAVL